MLATYMRRMRNINLEIRIAGFSCHLQLNPDNIPAKNGQIVSSAEAKSTADLKVKYYWFNFTAKFASWLHFLYLVYYY